MTMSNYSILIFYELHVHTYLRLLINQVFQGYHLIKISAPFQSSKQNPSWQ